MLQPLARPLDNPHHPLIAWGRKHGLPTVSAMAGKLGISQPRLSQIILRKHRPSAELALTITEATNIPLRDLLRLTPSEKRAGITAGWAKSKRGRGR